MHYFFDTVVGIGLHNILAMFRAIGFLIILWGISQYFSSSLSALDDAAVASFEAIETSARVSQQQLLEK